MNSARGNRDSNSRQPDIYLRYSTLGLQFALTLLLFVYGGHWLDQKYDIGPWGTLAGVSLGFVGGFVWLFQEVYGKPSGQSDKTDPNKTDSKKQT